MRTEWQTRKRLYESFTEKKATTFFRETFFGVWVVCALWLGCVMLAALVTIRVNPASHELLVVGLLIPFFVGALTYFSFLILLVIVVVVHESKIQGGWWMPILKRVIGVCLMWVMHSFVFVLKQCKVLMINDRNELGLAKNEGGRGFSANNILVLLCATGVLLVMPTVVLIAGLLAMLCFIVDLCITVILWLSTSERIAACLGAAFGSVAGAALAESILTAMPLAVVIIGGAIGFLVGPLAYQARCALAKSTWTVAVQPEFPL